jgi:galactose oxidase-like protein/Kelch motif protein
VIRTSIQSFKMTRKLVLSGLLITGLLGNSAVKAFAAAGSFALTGSLNTARYYHTATLLANGEVLVTGGLGVNGTYLASAELFDPAKGKWTVTGSMSAGRFAFTATLLPNGEVLVAGGSTNASSCFATAELYNPSTMQWTPTGSMTQPRCHHSATLLPTGEVLVAGGVDSLFNSPDISATAELYNPSTGTWQTTGRLNTSRASQVALLENGRVLVAGGYNTSNGTSTGLATAELYDPSKGSWSLTASMRLALPTPTTPVLLPNSDVLIGDAAQFYNPGTAAWVSTGPLPTIAGPPTQASLLNTGNALASGTRCIYSGCGHKATEYCYLYTTSTNSWSRTGNMNAPRLAHSSTLLPNGQVLVAGGYAGNLAGPIVLSSAELYTP